MSDLSLIKCPSAITETMHHTRGQRMASNKFPRVWVLQGQGSPDTTSPRTVQLALRDSENPVAHALLIACHDAFIKDFESLSADERPDANLPHEMFSEPRSLLTSCRKHPTNAIIAKQVSSYSKFCAILPIQYRPIFSPAMRRLKILA